MDQAIYEFILALSGAVIGALAAWYFAWRYYKKALADAQAAQTEIMRHVTRSIGNIRVGKNIDVAVDVASLGLKTEAGKRFAGLLLGSALSIINKAAETQPAD